MTRSGLSADAREQLSRLLRAGDPVLTPQGAAAALLLAHVAWNRAVDPLGGDQVGYYRKLLALFQAENPNFMKELKSTDCEAMIQELTNLKLALYPTDGRMIRLCGFTPRGTVRVEWHHRGVDGVN